MTASDARVGGALPVGVTRPTPDVGAWLDERTEQELQPPCEAKWTKTGEPCGNAATWIVYTSCEVHGPSSRLYCDLSLAKCRNGLMRCTKCAPAAMYLQITSAEPLR